MKPVDDLRHFFHQEGSVGVHWTASQDTHPVLRYPFLNISQNSLGNFYGVSNGKHERGLMNIPKSLEWGEFRQASVRPDCMALFVGRETILWYFKLTDLCWFVHHSSIPSWVRWGKAWIRWLLTYQIFLFCLYNILDTIIYQFEISVSDQDL